MAAHLCVSTDLTCTPACAPGAGGAAVTTKSAQVRDMLCELRGKTSVLEHTYVTERVSARARERDTEREILRWRERGGERASERVNE